jgi:hypothetical protein
MTRRIRVQDPSGGEYADAELPADVEVSRLLPALVTRLGLPVMGESANPISYGLLFGDRPLTPDETLAAAGVRDDDTLILFTEADADRKFAYASGESSPERGRTSPMGRHTLQVDTDAVLEVFKRGLFSDPRVAIRELLFNAHDACVLRLAQDPTFADPRIEGSTSAVSGTITFADNGAGMSAEELRDYLSTIGGSSKRLLQKSGVEKPLSLIGGFGIGSLAAASIARKVEVFTRSWRAGPGLKWTYEGSSEYSIEEVPKDDVGTRVVLHLLEEHRDLLDTAVLAEIFRKFVPAITTPVYLSGSAITGEDFRSTTPTTIDRFFLYSGKPISPRNLRLVALAPSPPPGFGPADTAFPKRVPELDMRLGALRVDLKGLWSTRDFTGMMQTFERAYEQFGSVYHMSQHLSRAEISAILQEVSINPQTTTQDAGEEFVRATTQALRALGISQIRLASPGFVEFIGSLNPLKLIADFIIQWRAQTLGDTKSAREAEIERLKINADVAKTTLAGLLADVRQKAPLNETIAGVLRSVRQTGELMTETARDVRLVQVSVEEIDLGRPGANESGPTLLGSGEQT